MDRALADTAAKAAGAFQQFLIAAPCILQHGTIDQAWQ